MSLFKAREWSSTWCGNAEEEFDCGSLCVANIDNSSDNLGMCYCFFLGWCRFFVEKGLQSHFHDKILLLILLIK